MTTELDLSQLALDRKSSEPSPRVRRRAIFSRYILPGIVLLGFLTMLGWAARDQFLPRTPVTVVPVVVTRAEVQQADTPLFQAAGWIEPRPTPVLAAAFAEGIVAELLVVEGQDVEAGQPVARLVDLDAKLALEQAEADLALRAAELESAQTELRAAQLKLENPVHLQAMLSEAQSQLAKTETELARLPFLIDAARARLEFARQNLAGKQAAEAALAGRIIQQAQSTHDSALAELNELEGRTPSLHREAEALRERAKALSQQLVLLIDETRAVADAEARVKIAQARQRQAELAVEAAQLHVERMIVRAPVAGRILALVARPGSRVMGLATEGEHQSSTVVTLYDPKSLQVRADVRLEEVPLVQPGQPVEIETASSQEPIQGRVLYATSQANIQKNTLEVKVAVIDPPSTIRPEMLVTTTFLAPEQPDPEPSSTEPPERLLIPRQLVESEGDAHYVWVADPTGTARRNSIRLGKAGTEQLVEVLDGLTPTDRLISGGREQLREGDSITITGEDDHLGIAASVQGI